MFGFLSVLVREEKYVFKFSNKLFEGIMVYYVIEEGINYLYY